MSVTQKVKKPAVVRLTPTRRERLGSVAAALAIIAIVIGVPAVLVLVFGSPLPTELPGGDVLTAPVSTDALLAAVAVLVWLAWLHFVTCLVVEAVSAVRARGLPRPVPLGAASQPLARRLVVTALLLVAAAGVFDRGHDGGDRSTSASVAGGAATASAEERVAAAEHAAQRASAGTTDRLATSEEPAAVAYDGEFQPGTKIYTVQPPKGRYHDNLWDIAERHLGDGRRYREIFDLNKDREQPFGGRLQLARLIHPGWLLVMPADAVGVDVVPAAPRPAVAPVAAPVEAPSIIPTAMAENSTAEHRAAAGPAVAAADDGGVSGREILAAGLLSAGLLAALSTLREVQRRRRAPGTLLPVPAGDAAEIEVTLRLAADPDGSELLGRALRGLAGACAVAGRPFPDVFAVRLGPHRIELLLTSPAGDPLHPFVADEDGRRWSMDRRAALDGAGPDDPSAPVGPPPLPGLVGLGREVEHENTHVLVDLEAAGGPVSVTGDPVLVREFLTAAAAELATNGWSGRVVVTCVGLDEGLVALAPDRVRIATDLDQVLEAFESRPFTAAVGSGIDSVLTGRLGGQRGDLFVPDYLVLGEAPNPAQADRLVALAAAGHLSRVGVLVAGPVAGARWRLELADTASIPVLGLEVVPQRLTRDSIERVVALARTAGLEPQPPSAPWTQPVAASEPRGVHLRSAAQVPSVEVRILGPLEVAGLALDEARRSARTEEIVTFLALRPEAATRADLVTALWPGGATDESVTAALRRTRDWLGADPQTHQPLLDGGEDGPWRLSSSVRTDWDLFQSLVLRGGHDDLHQALGLVRGSLLARRPHGRYAWLARLTIEYDVPVLVADTAHRVARVALLRGDVEPAAAAARTGLGVDRDALALWRDLLEAEGRRDPEAARRVAEAMRDRFGQRLDSATQAVIASVLGEAADVASGW